MKPDIKERLKERDRKARATRAVLVDTFPKCFAPRRASKLPLAVGIHADIRALLPEIGAGLLAAALIDYTGGPTYLSNVVEGAPRFGLDGKPCGVVTAAQAAHAAERLKLLKNWKAKQEVGDQITGEKAA